MTRADDGLMQAHHAQTLRAFAGFLSQSRSAAAVAAARDLIDKANRIEWCGERLEDINEADASRLTPNALRT